MFPERLRGAALVRGRKNAERVSFLVDHLFHHSKKNKNGNDSETNALALRSGNSTTIYSLPNQRWKRTCQIGKYLGNYSSPLFVREVQMFIMGYHNWEHDWCDVSLAFAARHLAVKHLGCTMIVRRMNRGTHLTC
jgi:hypothetical protein